MRIAKNNQAGFTIVELLVVIVVIGILAAITAISYSGISKQAVIASMKSDIASSIRSLKLYNTEYSSYPTTLTNNCPSVPLADDKYCLKTSGNNQLIGYTGTSKSFYLMIKNNTICYDAADDSELTINEDCIAQYIAIDNQIWMARNLNVGTMLPNGATLPQNNGTIEKWCYDNLESNCTAYGGLYNWNEAMKYVTTPGSQGICPAGSHIPTDDEWKTLEIYLGMAPTQADATGWRGTDQSTQLKTGYLNILLGGFRGDSTNYVSMSANTYLLTSSRSGSYPLYRRFTTNGTINRSGDSNSAGFSLRCIKN